MMDREPMRQKPVRRFLQESDSKDDSVRTKSVATKMKSGGQIPEGGSSIGWGKNHEEEKGENPRQEEAVG